MYGPSKKLFGYWISTCLLILTSISVSFAELQPPPPTPSKAVHKPKANPAQHEEPAAKDQRGTESSPLIIKVVPPTAIEPESAKEHEEARDYTSSEWWLVYLTGALSFITLVLALYTGKLYRATVALGKEARTTSDRQAGEMKESLRIAQESATASRDAADVAHAAMIAGERAFIFAHGFKQHMEKNSITGFYHWRFRPTWMNSGDTPTKNMTIHTRCLLRTGNIPPDFDFDYPTPEIGVGLIPPRTPLDGGLAPPPHEPGISPQDILDIQAGKKILYVMGWAKYSDIFPNTPPHITRFCWVIHVSGNPMTVIPPSDSSKVASLGFAYSHNNVGNCIDDECE